MQIHFTLDGKEAVGKMGLWSCLKGAGAILLFLRISRYRILIGCNGSSPLREEKRKLLCCNLGSFSSSWCCGLLSSSGSRGVAGSPPEPIVPKSSSRTESIFGLPFETILKEIDKHFIVAISQCSGPRFGTCINFFIRTTN